MLGKGISGRVTGLPDTSRFVRFYKPSQLTIIVKPEKMKRARKIGSVIIAGKVREFFNLPGLKVSYKRNTYLK